MKRTDKAQAGSPEATASEDPTPLDDVIEQVALERLYGLGCFSGEMLAELRLKRLRERGRS